MSGGGNRAACLFCEGTPPSPSSAGGALGVASFFMFFTEVGMIAEREVCELLLVNRNFLYQLFYKAFAREPDEAFLRLLTAENTADNLALLGGEVLEEAPEWLRGQREKLDDPDMPERMREEYNRLFVGPLEMEAPPWESIYLGKEGMLFQESTLKVRACYRRFGLLPEAYPRVADDSLALELGFMAELARRSLDAFYGENAAALEETLRGALDFLNEHLLLWIPQLLERIAKTETDWLYPRLVLYLDSFIKKDRETLNDLIEEGVHAHD